MKRLLVVVLISITGIVNAEPIIKGTASELRGHLEGVTEVVNIEGSAISKVSSDKAVIKLLILTEAPTLAQALVANSKLRKRVRTQLASSGIEESSIKDYKFSSTPDFGLFSDQPKSYKVDNILSVEVASEEQMVKVASIADREKSIRYISSSAEVGDSETIRADLLKKALSNAKRKASFYESELGVKLKVVSFSETSFNSIEPQEVPGRRDKRAIYSSAAPSEAQFGYSKFIMSVTVKYRVVSL
jgi:uncharacterized protein YggE